MAPRFPKNHEEWLRYVQQWIAQDDVDIKRLWKRSQMQAPAIALGGKEDIEFAFTAPMSGTRCSGSILYDCDCYVTCWPDDRFSEIRAIVNGHIASLGDDLEGVCDEDGVYPPSHHAQTWCSHEYGNDGYASEGCRRVHVAFKRADPADPCLGVRVLHMVGDCRYNPQTQGALAGISWSFWAKREERSGTETTDVTILGPVIAQGGKYYTDVNSIDRTSVPETWTQYQDLYEGPVTGTANVVSGQTIAGSAINATPEQEWVEIVDNMRAFVDASSHPDFQDGPPITFGVLAGAGDCNLAFQNFRRTILLDRLCVEFASAEGTGGTSTRLSGTSFPGFSGSGKCPSNCGPFEIAVAGVVDGTCSQCNEDFNGVFRLNFSSGCQWQTGSTTTCGTLPGGVRYKLNYYGGAAIWELVAAGNNNIVVYRISESSFNCRGVTTMTKTSEKGDCTGWPDEIEVVDVGGSGTT